MASDTGSDIDMEVDTGNFQLLLPLIPLENIEFDEDFPSDDELDQLMQQVDESESDRDPSHPTCEANTDSSVNSVNDSDPKQQNTEPGDTSQTNTANPPSTIQGTTDGQNKRFRNITEEDLKALEEHKHSESTKRNTQWGINLFSEWYIESGLPVIDFSTVASSELANHLRTFYASATPKQTEARKKSLPENLSIEYHKNTLKNLRAALNRHLKDIGRQIDIVQDKEFKQANDTLNAKLKYMVKSGLSRPTQHKKFISPLDQQKIASYLEDDSNAQVLQYKVWYSLAIHFVSRGLEFHHQLSTTSFEFLHDEVGRRYVTFAHETQQKNRQGGLKDQEAIADKRMYATNEKGCPVAALEKMIEHSDPCASALFCRVRRSPVMNIWYTSKALSKTMFTKFMPSISEGAGCVSSYTAHSVRATAIQILSDAGFDTRHIMLMSGHRNEASIRSYSRDCADTQKREMSDVLSCKGDGSSIIPALPLSSTSSRNEPKSRDLAIASTSTSVCATSGLLANSVFNNCSFNFNMNKETLN